MAAHKSTLFQPTFAFPMVSVCVLVGAFLVYYFPITARQEASLNRRAFRSLAAVSDSLVNRLANQVEVLEQRSKRPGSADSQPRGAVDVAIAPGTPNSCQKDQIKATVNAGTATLVLTCADWQSTLAMDRILPPYLRGTPGDLFDDVLLADAQGAVIYQSVATGSRINSLGSALRPPGAGGAASDQKSATASTPTLAFGSASQASTLVATVIAGESYLLYLVPVPLRLSPAATTDSSHLILAGLMRASRFRADSLALPGTVLISAILLVLIVIVATWPLLKFATMSTTDRIPRRSAVYLFLTTLATLLLVSILAIHLRYTVNMRTIDDGLERLAESIEKNLATELRLALRVIDSVNGSAKLSALLTPPAPGRCEMAPSNEQRIWYQDAGILARTGVRLSDYPYFDRIFWADSNGFQHIKWEAGRATSATYVGDRDYFVETAANRLWQLSDATPGTPRFRIDPILSRNTGEYRAVITRPAPQGRICADIELASVSMVTPLLSLIDPILPPDHGFALVDANGRVLFHSTGTKNGEERFLDEVEDATELRAALFARQGKLLTARYLGLDHRLFVTPLITLRDSPWSLIVFHDLAAGASQHLERIVLFSVMTLIFFIVLALTLLMAPATRGPRGWMWPVEEHRGAYLHLTITMALIAVPLYSLLFATSRPATVLLVAALVPAIVLGMGTLKVRPLPRTVAVSAFVVLVLTLAGIVATEPESKGYLSALVVAILAALAMLFVPGVATWLAAGRKPSLSGSYAAVWAGTLALVAVLPCIGFFRVAYDHHGNLSTRRQQVQTMAALAAREDRIKAQYGGLTLSSTRDAATSQLAQWLFVRRRLEETLDRYDAVLLNPDSGQLFSKDTGLGRVFVDPDRCDDGLSRAVLALASLEPYGNAALTRTLTASSSSRSAWRWCREGSNRLRLVGRGAYDLVDRRTLSLPPTRALLKSATGDPVFLHPELLSELPVLAAWWWPFPMFALALTALTTYAWMTPTIRRLFLLELPHTEPVPEVALDATTDLSRNLVLLTFEPARVGELLRRRDDVHVIDMAEVARGQAPAVDAIPAATIALEHFDYRHDHPEANARKLELLERLAARHRTAAIVIVTASDPEYLLAPPMDSGDPNASSTPDVERWSNALAGFSRVRVTPAGSTPAADFGRRVWASATTGERLALHQLAHDAWANSKNTAALEQLQRRGLIAGRPLRIVSPALDTFVTSIALRERKTWVPDEASAWDGIRLMFVVVLLGVLAAALFFSQQSVLGLVATGLGVLTPITKLLSEANSFRSLLGFGKAVK